VSSEKFSRGWASICPTADNEKRNHFTAHLVAQRSLERRLAPRFSAGLRAGSILKHNSHPFRCVADPPSLKKKKKETASLRWARTEILLFCTSSDPIRVNVIDLDGQRVRGLLRGRTVESRTLRRCRNLGREGECTGGLRNLHWALLSGKQINLKCVLSSKRANVPYWHSFFRVPSGSQSPIPLIPYSPAPVFSSPKPRDVWE